MTPLEEKIRNRVRDFWAKKGYPPTWVSVTKVANGHTKRATVRATESLIKRGELVLIERNCRFGRKMLCLPVPEHIHLCQTEGRATERSTVYLPDGHLIPESDIASLYGTKSYEDVQTQTVGRISRADPGISAASSLVAA